MHACSKGFESDASIRQFLAHGRESSKADEGGPSLLDIRELRSLSLSIPSFSLLGPPIGVSLPDCDLRALRDFIKAGTSTKVTRLSASLSQHSSFACLLIYAFHLTCAANTTCYMSHLSLAFSESL